MHRKMLGRKNAKGEQGEITGDIILFVPFCVFSFFSVSQGLLSVRESSLESEKLQLISSDGHIF